MRVSIVGSSGSGKTTLARALAERTGAHHIEIDAFHHQPDWQPRPGAELIAEIEAVMDTHKSWVCDGNYIDTLDGLAQQRADTIVWLDYPRPTVIWALTKRTLRRGITREELWNGNREPLTNFTRWAPEKNVIRWSWVHHHRMQERYERAATSEEWSRATVVRLRGRDETDRWLEEL